MVNDPYPRCNSEAPWLRFRGEIVEGKGGTQILIEDPSGNPVELFQRSSA